MQVGGPQPRFEIHATGPKGKRLRFARDLATKAVERASELAGVGATNVVVIDTVDALRYGPPEFETLVAMKLLSPDRHA